MKERFEITSISKTNRTGVHELISFIGGVDEKGEKWHMHVEDAIDCILHDQIEFYVKKDNLEIEIIVDESPTGQLYLNTMIDNDMPNTLLSLELCLEVFNLN